MLERPCSAKGSLAPLGVTGDELIERAKAFLAAISSGAPAGVVEGFLAPHMLQDVFPDRLLSDPALREFRALQNRLARSRKVVAAHDFQVVNAAAFGDRVVLESIWTGSLAVDLGLLQHVEIMHVCFAQIFEFEDGRIARLRSSRCSDLL